MHTGKTVIPLQGAANFRDLGGYPAGDGRTVVSGRLFRSDDLSALTDADLGLLASRGIRTVIDFRDRREAVMHPDRLPESAEKVVTIPIEAGSLTGQISGELTRGRCMGIMISAYRTLANDFQPSFRQFFETVTAKESLPLVFHCTAGKDRTGVAAALLLTALGTDRETVMADYLLSQDLLKKKYIPGIHYGEDLAPLFGVFPEFLEAAFGVIDSQYGGTEAYLTDQLGVDMEQLREQFTE